MTRMQSTLNVALVALALAGAGLVASSGQTGTKSGDTAGTADSATAMTAEARIEMGRHLTVIAGCTDCHTPGTL